MNRVFQVGEAWIGECDSLSTWRTISGAFTQREGAESFVACGVDTSKYKPTPSRLPSASDPKPGHGMVLPSDRFYQRRLQLKRENVNINKAYGSLRIGGRRTFSHPVSLTDHGSATVFTRTTPDGTGLAVQRWDELAQKWVAFRGPTSSPVR